MNPVPVGRDAVIYQSPHLPDRLPFFHPEGRGVILTGRSHIGYIAHTVFEPVGRIGKGYQLVLKVIRECECRGIAERRFVDCPVVEQQFKTRIPDLAHVEPGTVEQVGRNGHGERLQQVCRGAGVVINGTEHFVAQHGEVEADIEFSFFLPPEIRVGVGDGPVARDVISLEKECTSRTKAEQ